MSQPADAESKFFGAAAWWLFYTWRLYRPGALRASDVIRRREERREELQQLLADLRSFKRMSKDPNTYRAVFQSPKLRPDQMQVTILAPAEIEIHQATRDRWEAWHYFQGRRTAPLMTLEGNACTAGDQKILREKVRGLFKTELRAWEQYDVAGHKVDPQIATKG